MEERRKNGKPEENKNGRRQEQGDGEESENDTEDCILDCVAETQLPKVGPQKYLKIDKYGKKTYVERIWPAPQDDNDILESRA